MNVIMKIKYKENLAIFLHVVSKVVTSAMLVMTRVERAEYRRPKTYAVREEFSLILICWVEREKLLFLLFESGFDDAMNMENDNINNSLECLK